MVALCDCVYDFFFGNVGINFVVKVGVALIVIVLSTYTANFI